jgi:hypothetical protein
MRSTPVSRRPGVVSDGGSLPLAMLLALVAVSLSALLLPVAITQLGATRSTVTRSHALHAAQTGLEVAVAAVRGARGSTTAEGDRTILPCGPIEGSAGPDALATYRAQLTYFDDDPTVATAVVLTCPQARTGAVLPRYVRITSTGVTTGGTENRRALRGDYPLQTGAAAPPVPGTTWGPTEGERVQPRAINAWQSSDSDEGICLDPGSGRPIAGTKVKLQSCNYDNQDNGYKQFWFYRQDLSLATVGSILAEKAMCLDAGAAPIVGTAITMQPCVSPIPVRQRWYYTEKKNFELAVSTGPGQDDVALSGLCLNVGQPGLRGSALVLGGGANCRSAGWNSRQTFSYFTKIGPGEAGRRPIDCTAEAGYPCDRTQLVNYSMPSRCLDTFTGFIANMECVQDPDPAKVRWNQLWRLPRAADGATGTVAPIVTVNPAATTYCLTASSYDQPTQESCDPAAPTAGQKWTFYRNTGDEFSMYRITDYRGRCLTHANGDTTGSDPLFHWNGNQNHWKAHLDPCVNSYSSASAEDRYNRGSVILRQKWNAPFVLPTSTSPTDPAPTLVPTPMPAAAQPLRAVTEIQPGP